MLKSLVYNNGIVYGFEFIRKGKHDFIYAEEAKKIISKGNSIIGLSLTFSGDTWSCLDMDIDSVPKYSFENDFYSISDGVITGLTDVAKHFIDLRCEKIILPEFVNGMEVVELGESCFEFSEISSILLPNTLKKINKLAFSRSAISEIAIPDSCIKIGECAFMECYNLEELDLGEGVKSIGLGAFYDCRGLDNAEIFIPNSVEEIGEDAFGVIENAEFTIDNSVGNIHTLYGDNDDMEDEDYEDEDFDEDYDELDDFDDGFVEFFYGAYNVKVEYLR